MLFKYKWRILINNNNEKKTSQGKQTKLKTNWITLVSGVMAASSNLVSEQSTKEIFNPNSDATCLKYLIVPEAKENQIKWKGHCIKKC